MRPACAARARRNGMFPDGIYRLQRSTTSIMLHIESCILKGSELGSELCSVVVHDQVFDVPPMST